MSSADRQKPSRRVCRTKLVVGFLEKSANREKTAGAPRFDYAVFDDRKTDERPHTVHRGTRDGAAGKGRQNDYAHRRTGEEK